MSTERPVGRVDQLVVVEELVDLDRRLAAAGAVRRPQRTRQLNTKHNYANSPARGLLPTEFRGRLLQIREPSSTENVKEKESPLQATRPRERR